MKRKPPDFFWQVLSRLMCASYINDIEEKIFLLSKRQRIIVDIQKLGFLFSLEKVLRSERFLRQSGASSCPTSSSVALFTFDLMLMEMHQRGEMPELLGNQHLQYLNLIALLSCKPAKLSLKFGFIDLDGLSRMKRHCRTCWACIKESKHWKKYWREALDEAIENKGRFLKKTL